MVSPLLLNPAKIGLLAVCAGVFFLLFHLRNRGFYRPLFLAGTVLLVVSLVSALLSGYFWNGFEYSIVLGMATLLGATVIPDTTRDDRWVFWSLFVLGVFLLFSVILQYAHQVQLFGIYGLARLPVVEFSNANVLARFSGLLGLGLMATARNDLRRLAGVPFFLLVAVSGSRGAILALLAALVLLVLNHYDVRWTSPSVLGGLLIILLVSGVGLALFPSSVSRATSLQRIKLVRESVSMVLENPVGGVGGWNFGLVYPGFSLDGQWQRHPHSLPLWFLTAFGFGGTVLAGFGLWFSGDWSFRSGYGPLVGFILVHELVDTMVWIPGVLVLTVLVLAGAFKGSTVRTRDSRLVPVVAVVLVLGGLVTWKTEVDFKHGLRALQSEDYAEARSYWWNHRAGFTLAHRAVSWAKQGRFTRAARTMDRVRKQNRYDPYYRWLKAGMLQESGREDAAARSYERYNEMDPHGMLTLSGRRDERNSDSAGAVPEPVNFWFLWFNQNKPSSYIPMVRKAFRAGNRSLARRQVRFLLNFPKMTQHERSLLLKYRSRLGDQDSLEQSELSQGLPGEYRVFRGQFHYFFYRRPGSDYVDFKTLD